MVEKIGWISPLLWQHRRDQIKRQTQHHKVNIPKLRGDRRCNEHGKKQGNAWQIADEFMGFPADDHDTDAKEQNPAGHAHAPERAVDGHHGAQLDGDLLTFDDKRAADQRCVGDTKVRGAHAFCFCYQIKGIGIPVAVSLFYISGQIVSGITQAQIQPEPEEFFFVGDEVVLVPGPHKLLDIIGETGVVELVDVG